MLARLWEEESGFVFTAAMLLLLWSVSLVINLLRDPSNITNAYVRRLQRDQRISDEQLNALVIEILARSSRTPSAIGSGDAGAEPHDSVAVAVRHDRNLVP